MNKLTLFFITALYANNIFASDIQLRQDSPWVKVGNEIEVAPFRFILESDKGIKMASYNTALFIKGGNWVRSTFDVDGDTASLEAISGLSCANLLMKFKSGNNLSVAKLLKVDDSGDIKDNILGEQIVSNLAYIKVNKNHIATKNQVIVDGKRKVVSQNFRIIDLTKDGSSSCHIESVH